MTNGSSVMPKISGIESTAKTMSVLSIRSRTMNNGVGDVGRAGGRDEDLSAPGRGADAGAKVDVGSDVAPAR